MSLFNDIARRPHVPREAALRRMMRAVGMEVPEVTSRNLAGYEDDAAHDEQFQFSDDEAPLEAIAYEATEEDLESECLEDDPCQLA